MKIDANASGFPQQSESHEEVGQARPEPRKSSPKFGGVISKRRSEKYPLRTWNFLAFAPCPPSVATMRADPISDQSTAYNLFIDLLSPALILVGLGLESGNRAGRAACSLVIIPE